MAYPAHITLPSRFNGPPGTANGGYVAGRLASLLDGPVEVSLRVPPPLDRPIRIEETATGLEAYEGDTLIAAAVPADPLEAAMPAPTLEEASAARGRFPPVEEHAFPHCFVCGPERAEGDGLRIFTGAADSFEGVADIWTPAPEFAGEDGYVRPEILWAALDCPGAFAVGFQENPMVLGRIRGVIHDRPRAGERLIVAGWARFHDGRKHGAATALYTETGRLLAQTDQLWIELKTTPSGQEAPS
ncbi:hypothetical protein [Henriciella aquimarina]|uniref:hypothetical protein n=1 Tax=Henriciella aquimarina TaxID=545261 RepID=UPI0018EFA319|nr:hypothetical protein [Henriciella aquimarina]